MVDEFILQPQSSFIHLHWMAGTNDQQWLTLIFRYFKISLNNSLDVLFGLINRYMKEIRIWLIQPFYGIAYAIGYLLNFGLLWTGVDRLQLPHQVVQAVAIFAVAAVLFLMHRYWVFPSPARST